MLTIYLEREILLNDILSPFNTIDEIPKTTINNHFYLFSVLDLGYCGITVIQYVFLLKHSSSIYI